MFIAQDRSSSCRPTIVLALAAIALTSFSAHNSLGEDSDSKRDESISIRPDRSGLYRVRIELEVEGNVHVPKDPLISRKGELQLPIQTEAVLDYEERYRSCSGSSAPEGADGVTALERYYHKAESTTELNRRKTSVSLRDSVRSTIVHRQRLPEVIYSVEDYFERDELELLRTPLSSAAVDQMLPTNNVRIGDKYSPSAGVMASVLNLSAVESTDVVAEVVAISQTEARVQFRGDVQGSVDGIPTVVRAAGKVTFNRQQRICSWLAMAVHETREVGKAEPGFDVAGTIKMVRSSISEPAALPVDPSTQTIMPEVPEDRLLVDIHSERLGFRVLMNRHWRMMTDIPGAAMMRMIDVESSVAQCDFRPLATLQAGQQWTLEAFQKDVQKTLGDQLTGLIGADEQLSDSGLRVMRVTARGSVAEVPIQWILLHFSDDTGRRMLATFTMEGSNVDSFAASDDQLASSLRFTASSNSPDPEVANRGRSILKVAANPDEVESASDR